MRHPRCGQLAVPAVLRAPTAILPMRRSFAVLVTPLAFLLVTRTARAQGTGAEGTNPQGSARTAGSAKPDSVARADSATSASRRPRELGEVKVVARRSRSAGYLVTSSRSAMK